MTFTDAYERTIDAKGRLQIPSQIRESLEARDQAQVLYIVPGRRPGTLSIYPADEFESMRKYMDHEPIPDTDAYTFQQLFYSMTSQVELDKQGRMILPERILKRAGLQSEVVLTGVGNHMDIWNQSDYQTFVDQYWTRWNEVQDKARAASRKNVSQDSTPNTSIQHKG